MKRRSGSSSPIECRPRDEACLRARCGASAARAHAGHDAHVGDHVRAVGDLDAATRQRRIDRPHAVGNHVHGAAAHAAGEQRIHLRRAPRPAPSSGCSGRRRPRSRVQTKVRCSTRATSDGIGAVQVAVGMGLRVERDQVAAREHQRDQRARSRHRSRRTSGRCRAGSALATSFDPSVERLELAGHRSAPAPGGACKGKVCWR